MSTRKGKKGQKNLPIYHDEIKKTHGISVTPTAWKLLQEKAKIKGLSVSELIENWIRETEG